jgi:hypothetical protein
MTILEMQNWAENERPLRLRADMPIEISDAKRLARAVLMFYSGNPWTHTDRKVWKELTGHEEATTRVLGNLAREVMLAVEKK